MLRPLSHSIRRQYTKNIMSAPKTQETQVLYNDGEVAVKKSSGLIKVRKGQSEEEFQFQLTQFQEQGPLIQEKNYTLLGLDSELTGFESKTKIEKEHILHGLERLYYLKQYKECLEYLRIIQNSIVVPAGGMEGKKNKVLKRTVTDLKNLEERCIEKIHSTNISNISKTSL